VTGVVFIEEKPMEGREVEAVADAVIGREGTDIVVADPEVSRRHAAIRQHGDGVAIEDLGSTNGTIVNGDKVRGVQPLNDGDSVRVGNTVFRVRVESAAADSGATMVGNVQSGAPQVTAARAIPNDITAPPPGQQPAAPAPQAPAAAPQAPVPAGAASSAPRGDVDAPPEIVPSAVRRVLPPPSAGQAPAFQPPTAHRITGTRGSAARRVEATIICLLIVIAVAAAVTVYFATQGS
jgi:pSer/pThr/pTyr-binding forkhead associated (FHA) protein